MNKRMAESSQQRWVDFLSRATGDDSAFNIAQRSGTSESTISRWRSGASHPKPIQAVNVAKAYGLHPLEGLVGASFLDYEDIDMVAGNLNSRVFALEDFSTRELLAEIGRRISGEDE